MSFDGTATEGTLAQQISRTLDPNRRVPVKFEVELTMVTPAWVQDNSPEKLALMTPAEKAEATSMGLGWRLEHLFRGQGTLTLDGQTRPFNAVGSRIKRQSVRPLNAFRGHCWQSAVFPDGRAFGYIAYPPAGDGSEPHNDGYIYQNGTMYRARAVKIPWLRRIVEDSDDVSLALESVLGVTQIGGMSKLSSFLVAHPLGPIEMRDFHLEQGGACYEWDGQVAYGMIERSATAKQMTTGRS